MTCLRPPRRPTPTPLHPRGDRLFERVTARTRSPWPRWSVRRSTSGGRDHHGQPAACSPSLRRPGVWPSVAVPPISDRRGRARGHPHRPGRPGAGRCRRLLRRPATGAGRGRRPPALRSAPAPSGEADVSIERRVTKRRGVVWEVQAPLDRRPGVQPHVPDQTGGRGLRGPGTHRPGPRRLDRPSSAPHALRRGRDARGWTATGASGRRRRPPMRRCCGSTSSRRSVTGRSGASRPPMSSGW